MTPERAGNLHTGMISSVFRPCHLFKLILSYLFAGVLSIADP